MLWVQSMANILEFNAQNRVEPFFHNYKGFFSFVLLAIYDARYCFTLFDVSFEAVMMLDC